MSDRSPIEWTDATWNPVRGCSKVSPGCKHCYAEAFSERLRGIPGHPYEQGFDLRLVPEKIEEPLGWRAPRKVFVNSMSDLLHEGVPEKFIRRVFDVMVAAKQHTFQVLTKRSERLVELADRLPWPANVWMGVSVEDEERTSRIRDLAKIPAAVRFLSVEPLLGPITSLPLEGLDWVIVGGESGPRARPMELAWAREIRDECLQADVPFFLKQLGGRRSKQGGDEALLDGRLWRDFPSHLGRERSARRAASV